MRRAIYLFSFKIAMIYNYNKKNVANAQTLRKNMTPEEKHLWYDFLQRLPVTVNRQKNIGDYIVDFFIASKRIVIELDGSQHEMPENREADIKRDADFARLGITVLRYKNDDIHKKFDVICEHLLGLLELKVSDLKPTK